MKKPAKGKRKPILFARGATGLVKAANPSEATFWNVANIMGSKFPWSVVRLGLFPAALILGWSPYLWAVLLVGLAYYVLAFIYVQITSTIPRSGADYVIPSRLMGPFWGWLGSWMLVFSLVPLWGYVTWVTLRNIKQLVDILRIGGLITLSAPWILRGVPAFVLGMLVILSGMSICLLPAKRYYTVMGVLTAGAVVSLMALAAGALAVSPTAFDANLERLVGISSTGLIQTAIRGGFDPNGKFDLASTAELVGLALFSLTGFQSSATISGELKGDIRKSLSISIVGSLTLFLACFLSFVWVMLYKFNYDLVVGWSYLFWNNIPGTPFALPPINALLLTIGLPQLAIVWAAIGFILLLGAWLYIPASMLYINRIVLSWGIDRMIPSAFSEINPKFGQPLRLVFVEGVFAVIFFTLTLSNLNPIAYLWWSTLLVFPSLLFPAVSALMFHRRRPELWQFVPWQKLLKPLATLWMIIIIPIYLFAVVAGSLPSLSTETSLWQYALSSGLTVTGLVILIGIVVYVTVREFNTRRGVDVNLIFQSIPPE